MNRYAPSRPRAIFAMLATALAALNFAVLVALPAAVEARDDGPTALASIEEPHVDSGIAALEQARATRERINGWHVRARTSHAARSWARSSD